MKVKKLKDKTHFYQLVYFSFCSGSFGLQSAEIDYKITWINK